MASVGISKLGLTDLIFVDLGTKINGGYYRDVLLLQQLLPVMDEVSGDAQNPGADSPAVGYY